ncbi:hypothetical protein H0H93_001671 [Arthromyces matolae]|nr:hypothetical protein H0H93_001671 [Arthromyces matolae]
MDADTAALVQTIGNDLLHSFAAIVLQVLQFESKPHDAPGSRKGFKRVPMITLLALLVMYIMALIMWSFDVTDMAREIVVTLINNPDSPMSDKYAIAVKNTFDFVAAEDVLYAFMLVQVIGNVPGVEANPRLSFAMFVYSFSTSVVVVSVPAQ